MDITETTNFVLDYFPPFANDPDALFVWACDQLPPERLQHIASADYGRETKEHLEALQSIHAKGRVSVPLEWHPGEVLGLTSHCGDLPATAQGPPCRHVELVFCNAALLRVQFDVKNQRKGTYFAGSSTLRNLLVALHYVDATAQVKALHLIAWAILQMGASADRPWFALGFLLLRAITSSPDQEELQLLKDFVAADLGQTNASDSLFEGNHLITWRQLIERALPGEKIPWLNVQEG